MTSAGANAFSKNNIQNAQMMLNVPSQGNLMMMTSSTAPSSNTGATTTIDDHLGQTTHHTLIAQGLQRASPTGAYYNIGPSNPPQHM